MPIGDTLYGDGITQEITLTMDGGGIVGGTASTSFGLVYSYIASGGALGGGASSNTVTKISSAIGGAVAGGTYYSDTPQPEICIEVGSRQYMITDIRSGIVYMSGFPKASPYIDPEMSKNLKKKIA